MAAMVRWSNVFFLVFDKLGETKSIEFRYLESNPNYSCNSFISRPLSCNTKAIGELFNGFLRSLHIPSFDVPWWHYTTSCGEGD